jgi:hypothetical protein
MKLFEIHVIYDMKWDGKMCECMFARRNEWMNDWMKELFFSDLKFFVTELNYNKRKNTQVQYNTGNWIFENNYF